MHRMREGSLKSHPQDGREHPVGGRAVSLEHCFLGYWSTGGYEEGHWRIEYWRTED